MACATVGTCTQLPTSLDSWPMTRRPPPTNLQQAGVGAFFRPRDVQPIGVTNYDLQRMLADGRVERVGRGLYRLADVEATELETIAMVASPTTVPSAKRSRT